MRANSDTHTVPIAYPAANAVTQSATDNSHRRLGNSGTGREYDSKSNPNACPRVGSGRNGLRRFIGF